MRMILRCLFAFGLFLVSHVLWANTYWLDSRNDASLTHYRNAELACVVGEAQRRLDGYRAGTSLPLRYRPVNVGPDNGTGERECRTVIEKKLVFTGWITVEEVDVLVHGPNGSADACNISGLTDPVTGQCGSPKRPLCCSGVADNGSDPIQTATGNKYQIETDFVGAGPWPLRFTRTYNSYMAVDNRPTPLGPGWTHNYQRSIAAIAASNGGSAEKAYAYRPDGGILTFTRVNGAWTSDPDVSEKLTESTSGGVPSSWTLTTRDDTVEHYDRTGRLVSLTRRDGFVQTLSYSGAHLSTVTGPGGRTLSFAHDGNGRLTSVTASDGTTVQYTYDSAGNLASASYPAVGGGTVTKTYLYNESGQTGGVNQPHALTGLIDESQQRYASWAYGADHRATLSVQGTSSGSIGRTTFTYNANGTNTITDALGQARAFGFDAQYGIPHLSSLDTPCDYCGAIGASATYDSNGYPSQATDFRGNQTQFTYNSRGLQTQRVQATGTAAQRTIQTDWSSSFRVPTEQRVLDANGTLMEKADWVYNSRGQPLARCEVDPAQAGSYTCAATGTPPAGVRRWTYTYCDAVNGTQCPLVGLRLSVTGPRTDLTQTTTYGYYTDSVSTGCGTPGGACHQPGDLHQVTDALGHVTTIASYDANGRITRVTDPNGVNTDLAYTPRGWLASRSLDGATTTFTYTPYGAVASIADPDGVTTSYTYDNAHRLTDITDAQGNEVQYTLDAAGNKTREQIRDSNNLVQRSTSRSFNTLGRLTAIVDGLNHTVFDAGFGDSYDANGNLVHSANAIATEHQMGYDALNRLISDIRDYNGSDPATADTQSVMVYDAMGRTTGVSDPDNLSTVYTYNGLGDRTGLQSPDTGSSSDTYDAAGNRITHTDAKSQTSTFTYDALDRTTGIQYSDSTLDVTDHYDEAGSVTGCTNSAPIGRLTRMVKGDTTTTYCYDTRGNVTRKTQDQNGTLATITYSYTAGDRLQSVTYPDSTEADYAYDSIGRVQSLSLIPPDHTQATAITAVSNISYLPFGPITSYTLANGQTITRSYDANYRLTDLTSPLLNLHYARDALGNITAMGNAPGANPPTESYSYDALQRLTAVIQQPGGATVESYTYNKTGDRLSKTGNGQATGTYAYASGTHHLISVGSNPYSVDANGETTSLQRASGTYTFTYNARQRMTTAQAGSNAPASYTYNALGERIRKTMSAANDRFAYDEAGHLLSRDRASGTRDYIWLGDMPVALVDEPSGGGPSTESYVVGDDMGSPRVATNDSGNELWSWSKQGNSFGEQPPTSNAGFDLNLRFAGQYQDVETGVNYNFYRNYDPFTGRYLRSDPVGLAGGVSTYAYTENNPLTDSDPFGLATLLIVGARSPGINGGIGNPFGHVSLAVTGSGIYSFGTTTPYDSTNATPLGSSVSAFLLDQARYRNSTAYIINTTPAQEAKILTYLQSFKGIPLPKVPGPDSSDTCASRSNEALRKAGIYDPSTPYSLFYASPFPGNSRVIGMFYSNSTGGSAVEISKGTKSLPAILDQFNPKP